MEDYSRDAKGVHIPLEVQRLAERAGVPKRFRDSTLFGDATDGLMATSQAFVQSFSSNTGEGMLFAGPTGMGKTHFAAATLNEVLRVWRDSMDVEVFFLNVQRDLPALLDNRYFRRYDQYAETLRRAEEASLVVMDDLLHVPNHEFSKELLYRIYEARYSAMLPTITTLNADLTSGDSEALDWSPISNMFNEPFMRRLVQTAGNNIVIF